MVSKEKHQELINEMGSLGIQEDDLIERFVLGRGSGGQKVNKTASCVYLKHIPSGIEVKCQASRERELNRFLARRALCEKLKEKVLGKNKATMQRDKIRKQKKRKQRKTKNKYDPD